MEILLKLSRWNHLRREILLRLFQLIAVLLIILIRPSGILLTNIRIGSFIFQIHIGFLAVSTSFAFSRWNNLLGVVRILYSQCTEIWMVNGFSCCDSFVRIHLKHPLHKFNFGIIHNCCISSLDSFRVRYFGEFKTLVPLVSIEFSL